MPVNLSDVDISLQQFQDISSGKYNAGQVKLASATTLDKMNHHVRQTFRNDERISHQEVIAIKEALVKALSTHGVGAEEIGQGPPGAGPRAGRRRRPFAARPQPEAAFAPADPPDPRPERLDDQLVPGRGRGPDAHRRGEAARRSEDGGRPRGKAPRRERAPKDRVYAEMEALNRKIETPVRTRLALAGKEVGPDDVNPLRSVMTTMLAGLRPGLGGLVAGLFAKPEVKKGLDDGQDYGMFGKTGSFNILSTDPQTHLDGDLQLENLRLQSFFVAPRNAAHGTA